MSQIKANILEAMKATMRAQDKQRLGTIRLIMAAMKQKEVDERVELTDADVLAILDKMLKQRRDSIQQFQAAHRQDLVDQETFEVSVIQSFMPAQLSAEAINTIIQHAIAEVGAKSMQDMGKIMALVKPQVQGRSDVAQVSQWVKQALGYSCGSSS